MRTIVGRHTHDEILRLIEQAERMVVLASPFIRPWPELRVALARAVLRGVHLEVYTRGPQGAPAEAELSVFGELEIPVRELPGLHLKAYLSERAAIHASVNLTREAVGKAMESSMWFDRETDRDGWLQVFELWQKLWDERERQREGEPMSVAAFLGEPADETSAGPGAPVGGYCVSCREALPEEGEWWVCLRCRADAIVRGLDTGALPSAWCPRCGAPYRASAPDRPLCGDCYRAERASAGARPIRWFVSGAPGAIQVWCAARGERTLLDSAQLHSAEAVARRWPVLMPAGGWLSVVMTTDSRRAVPTWATALPHEGPALGSPDGVVVERAPTGRLPPCLDAPGVIAPGARHLAYTSHREPQAPVYWVEDQPLMTWASALRDSGDPRAPVPPAMVLQAFL